MRDLRAEFLALPDAARREVQMRLGALALERWRSWLASGPELEYTESVVGTRQRLDPDLPAELLAAAGAGCDRGRLAARLLEPLAALQDGDLELPREAEFAFYALSNLFRRRALGEATDDWLVVGQALAALGPEAAGRDRLADAVEVASGRRMPS